MPAGLYLKQVELGPMQNFVYLVGDQASRECVVVDPAWEIEGIADLVAADDMRLTGVLVTHTHQDHVGGHLFGHDMNVPRSLDRDFHAIAANMRDVNHDIFADADFLAFAAAHDHHAAAPCSAGASACWWE